MSLKSPSRNASRAAFSWIEAAGVLAIGCVLSAVGLPVWLHRAEKQCAGEAIAYLEHIKQLQQEHFAEHGYYAADPMTLDLAMVVPATFSIDVTSDSDDAEQPTSWTMTLIRQGAAYCCDKYRVTYNQFGLVPEASLIESDLFPHLSSVMTSQIAR